MLLKFICGRLADQTIGLANIATYRAAIAAMKMLQFCFKISNMDTSVRNKQTIQYCYVKYKCAFFVKINYKFRKIKHIWQGPCFYANFKGSIMFHRFEH